jgi:hypothetical protein
MADFTVTPANVLASVNATIVYNAKAGATITAGQNLYKDTDNTMKLLDANGADPSFKFAGIALNGASAGQPIAYVVNDPDFTPGYALAAGDVVITSGTAGASAPVDDAASGWYVTVLGVGKGNNKMALNPVAAGAAHA